MTRGKRPLPIFLTVVLWTAVPGVLLGPTLRQAQGEAPLSDQPHVLRRPPPQPSEQHPSPFSETQPPAAETPEPGLLQVPRSSSSLDLLEEDLGDPSETGCGAEPCSAAPSRQLGGHLLEPRYRVFGRHSGRGDPLVTESWLYRPWSVGWSIGYAEGSPPTSDWRVGKQQGVFGALRLGWDHNYHWGLETRVAFDTMNAESLQWDMDLLCYPWGDSRWRPYLMAGAGVAKIRFREGYSPGYDQGRSADYQEIAFVLPVAVGLKYRWNDWIALRLEVGDNIMFAEGSGLNVLVNLAATAGMELHFGGPRTSYWPWNPGRHYW